MLIWEPVAWTLLKMKQAADAAIHNDNIGRNWSVSVTYYVNPFSAKDELTRFGP